MKRRSFRSWAINLGAIAGLLALASTAHASAGYDGSWDLVFLTKRGACDASYNFTVNIANGVVIVPTFNDPNDRLALNTLASVMPARHVIGIHAVDLVWGLGTLHCLTQQEPAVRSGVAVSHARAS